MPVETRLAFAPIAIRGYLRYRSGSAVARINYTNSCTPPSCMENTEAARNALHGTTLFEKLVSIGIERGRMVEIRNLDAVGRDYGIAVYLFFEKDLATGRTLAQVEDEFCGVPEYERPYVRVDRFLTFTQENDPSFTQTLDDFPLMIEILSVSEQPDPATGRPLPVVTGLMPFLGEFDVDSDPVERSGQKLR